MLQVIRMCHIASKDQDQQRALHIYKNLTDVSQMLLQVLRHEVAETTRQSFENAQAAQAANRHMTEANEALFHFTKTHHEGTKTQMQDISHDMLQVWKTLRVNTAAIEQSILQRLQGIDTRLTQVSQKFPKPKIHNLSA